MGRLPVHLQGFSRAKGFHAYWTDEALDWPESKQSIERSLLRKLTSDASGRGRGTWNLQKIELTPHYLHATQLRNRQELREKLDGH